MVEANVSAEKEEKKNKEKEGYKTLLARSYTPANQMSSGWLPWHQEMMGVEDAIL